MPVPESDRIWRNLSATRKQSTGANSRLCAQVTEAVPSKMQPPFEPIMKSILSGVLAGEKFGRAESSVRALPIEFIELSRISYGV